MDGLTRQKRFVRSSLLSTSLLCASLVAVFTMWIWILLWTWDVPTGLMILRLGLMRTARPHDGTTTSGNVTRSAAAEYAAKNLQ